MSRAVAPHALLAELVLPHFPDWQEAEIAPLSGGLINETFLLTHGARRAVLQRVSPIFPPAIHANIQAVTQRLTAAGLATPDLLPTREGRTHLVVEESGPAAAPTGAGTTVAGVWRLLSFVEGVSFDVLDGPEQARAAGHLVARFHAALEGLPYTFVGLRQGVHDTPLHLRRLREALSSYSDHRLTAEVAPLAEELAAAAEALPPLPAALPRLGHGDLKFNNILFAGREGAARQQAVCLIDLDTVGPVLLAHELGDAWRSWCNRAGEDSAVAELDLGLFEASWEGYASGPSKPLDQDERRALLLGVEWVSLELAARFLGDALRESYFGWNPAKFPGRGEHNLLRARGQWSLHRALAESRPRRARVLGAT